MFLFEPISWQAALMLIIVVAGLMLLNQLARMNKWIAIGLFIVLPIILITTLWQDTATADSSTGTWFHWVKVVSVLIGCIGILYIRYSKTAVKNKYWLLFPPILLAVNILEAVIRDFQCYGLYSGEKFGEVVNMVTMQGGPWNILNGIAGIISIITITGWAGIYICKDKYKDMVWPDMLWWWIIAYDLWNFAYVYNCVSDHAFYAGVALLAACTIPAFFFGKGAWLQHRAHTLAFWMMFAMSFPAFIDTSRFAVKSSHNPTALWVVSSIALAVNLAVLIYQIRIMIKRKCNPAKVDVYSETKAYKEVIALRAK